MSSPSSPFLPSHYALLPRGGHQTIVDFWSTLFVSPNAAQIEQLAQFPRQVTAQLQQLGYRYEYDEPSQQYVAFSSGLLGLVRPMWILHNHHASAIIYFQQMTDKAYISLRVVYRQPFSWLKLLWFVLVVLGIDLLGYANQVIENYPYYYWYPDDSSKAEYVAQSVWEQISYYPLNTLLGVGLTALAVFMVWGGVSWWRTGRWLAFLREDFQEIYRDDLASIGEAAYKAILEAADALSLQTITPVDASRPAFGTGTTLAPRQRAPRI